MMKRIAALAVLGLTVIGMASPGRSLAQEQETHSKDTPESSARLVEAYRLDFSVNEIEEGKKLNTRQYSMNLNANDSEEIKIGTRVPVEAKQGEFQYLDVGTSIWSKLDNMRGPLELKVRAELSNFAIPEQQGQQVRPVLRQLDIKASTVVLVGKPMVVGSVDDPNSKRQYQLEVVVTKLR